MKTKKLIKNDTVQENNNSSLSTFLLTRKEDEEIQLSNIHHLKQDQSPILIVAYKNFSLDQFLEGCLDFCDLKDIVRIGSRSQSNKLKDCFLSNLRRTKNKDSDYHELRDKLTFTCKRLKQIFNELERAKDGIVSEYTIKKLSAKGVTISDFKINKFKVVNELITKEFDTEKPVNRSNGEKKIQGRILNNSHNIKLNYFLVIQKNEKQENKEDNSDSEEDLDLFLKDRKEIENEREFEDNNFRNQAQTKKQKHSLIVETSEERFDYKRKRKENRMVDILFEKLESKYEKYFEKYNKLCKMLKRFHDNIDFKIMKMKKIVGMTTTGVAQLGNLISDLKPSVILVEEAAEILESQLLSCLSDNVGQLILIGDHQQLRPSTNSYFLEKERFLCISLFERLILNGFQATVLNTQRRMNPEISQFLKPIYLKNQGISLVDHQITLSRKLIISTQKDKPNVPSIVKY